ncbi:MAG: acyltransferase [Lachnospiraceae bacterium]|nr:acyltransferase [Lachnospiraceae bacterium]
MKGVRSSNIFQNNIRYINGIKGFACIMVMLGHFLAVYKYAEEFPIRIGVLDSILNSKLSFLLNESYYLYLFFIVSGYLIARSRVSRVYTLVQKVVIRFLRLGVPILCSSALIFVLCIKVIGMHNKETSILFTNDFFQNNYYDIPITFEHLLYSPLDSLLFGEAIINPPYWCLKGMFIASIIIYIVGYLWQKFEKKPMLQISLVFLAIIGSLRFSFDGVRTACLVGMALQKFEEKKEDLSNSSVFAFWMIASSILLYIYEERIMCAILFAVLIFYIPKWKLSNSILSSKPFQFLGDISWGVFSFHYPILSSVGALTILNVRANVLLACIIGIAVSIILSILMAIVYRYTFEIVISKWINSLKKLKFENKRG